MDLDRAATIAGLKIKVVRDAVREMARHDMNDSGWTVTALADHMNISPTHAEWLSELLVEPKILERKPPPSWDKDPAPEIRMRLAKLARGSHWPECSNASTARKSTTLSPSF